MMLTSRTKRGMPNSPKGTRSKTAKSKGQSTLPLEASTSKTNTATPPRKKRKFVDLTQDEKNEDESLSSPASKTNNAAEKRAKKKDTEKRLRPWRTKAPQTFLLKLDRAQTQRMVVIGRTRSGQGENIKEDIDIVGSTGNIYTVTICQLPRCTCPDHAKGNECKHKVYALCTVLKAPYHLQYQRALLTEELRQIFAAAPPIPTSKTTDKDVGGKRKPIEGECPICYMDLEPAENELVWCKAGCGNNTHKSCFEQWAASIKGSEVKCVYCRTPWEFDHGDVEAIKKAGQKSGDGYVNVAEQFGIERSRDYSTYHQPWVRRTFGYGG